MESNSVGELIARTLRRAIPLSLHLLLTERCDLGCVHCYLPGARRQGRMELADYRRLLGEARAAGTLFVTLSGGEPTLRPDFFEIAEAVRGQALALKVISNGYSLAGEPAARLAALRPTKVSMSLYAAGAAAHDAVTRVPGSFARTVRAIEQLVGLGVPVTVKTPLMRANAGELPGLEALCGRLGAILSASPYLFLPQGSEERFADLACDDAQLREVLADQRLPERSLERLCGAGSNYVAVDPEGQVLPCPMFALSAGSLFESGFAEIWSTAPLLKQLRALSFDDLPTCRACSLRGHCLRCVGQVYARTGLMTAADPEACRVARSRPGC